MEYTTRLRTIVDLRSEQTFAARSIVYSVRNSWRRSMSLLWNAALARALEHNPLLRVSIHPADYSHPTVWRQIVDLIRTANGSRTVTTYQNWIGEQRVRRAG
jgi:predicted deacetylase